MSYSDDYVSVDLAITFVILDTLNIFLIDCRSSLIRETRETEAHMMLSITDPAPRYPTVMFRGP